MLESVDLLFFRPLQRLANEQRLFFARFCQALKATKTRSFSFCVVILGGLKRQFFFPINVQVAPENERKKKA